MRGGGGSDTTPSTVWSAPSHATVLTNPGPQAGPVPATSDGQGEPDPARVRHRLHFKQSVSGEWHSNAATQGDDLIDGELPEALSLTEQYRRRGSRTFPVQANGTFTWACPFCPFAGVRPTLAQIEALAMAISSTTTTVKDCLARATSTLNSDASVMASRRTGHALFVISAFP